MDAHPAPFTPPRRAGLLFMISLILLLLAGAITLFNLSTRVALGPLFLFYLFSALLLALPLPVLMYRLYALIASHYILERDGIRLKWGLREEDIPIDTIEWVQLAEDLVTPLQLPPLRWPGGLVGEETHQDLGSVEFLASQADELVLIGTKQAVYAISPTDRNTFLLAFQRQMELGSLSPLRAFSTRPNFPFAQIWAAPIPRALLLLSVLFSVALFVVAGVAIPTRETVYLGFEASGVLREPVAAEQLFLLPVVNLLLLIISFLFSAAFYQQDERHPLAYALWGTSALVSSLFLLAIGVILQIG